jgi:hypothetical protein
MITKRIRIVLVMLILPASLIAASSIAANPSEKDEILRICNQMFGAPVDAGQNLFEVDQFHVLRVKFNNRGRLEQLAVEPKYYFEESHPEWKEPDNFANLTKSEYENLLARLDNVKPKGALIKPAPSGAAVTNMTAWYKAVYENAVLEWGEVVDLRRGENAPVEIRWLRLTYQKPKRM